MCFHGTSSLWLPLGIYLRHYNYSVPLEVMDLAFPDAVAPSVTGVSAVMWRITGQPWYTRGTHSPGVQPPHSNVSYGAKVSGVWTRALGRRKRSLRLLFMFRLLPNFFYFLNFFFFFLRLFLRQRETEHERGRVRERETQNLKEAPGSELSAQSPMPGSDSRTPRS